MAQKYMVVVLGMEQREGPGAKEKADRLIEKHRHRFHDMLATYHPPDIPGEVAGKDNLSILLRYLNSIIVLRLCN